MIRKPISGDSDQRERQAQRARKDSQLSAARLVSNNEKKQTVDDPPEDPPEEMSPMHGSAAGESAHGAIPRQGIDSE